MAHGSWLVRYGKPQTRLLFALVHCIRAYARGTNERTEEEKKNGVLCVMQVEGFVLENNDDLE